MVCSFVQFVFQVQFTSFTSFYEFELKVEGKFYSIRLLTWYFFSVFAFLLLLLLLNVLKLLCLLLIDKNKTQ